MAERPPFDFGKTIPTIEQLESKWPSASAENRKFMRRMWEVRTPELLDQKIVGYLDQQGFAPKEARAAYESQRQMLEELFGTSESGLKRDMFYHGTGALKYGVDKYADESVQGEQTFHALDGILANGLRPHYDEWSPTRDAESVSLTESYFYSKWYAAKYMSEGNEPIWQLGDPNDYFPFFVFDSFKRDFFEPKNWPETARKLLMEGQTIRSKSKERAASGRPRENRFLRWCSSFNSRASEMRGFNQQLDAHSDIPENWGAVICVGKEGVEAHNDMLVLGTHESRAEHIISPAQFKAIGVPLRRIADARAMLDEKALTSTQVFAMEAAEIHFASFDIKDLLARTEGK